jgi:hypothetical protein
VSNSAQILSLAQLEERKTVTEITIVVDPISFGAVLVPAMPPAAEVHSRSECRAAQRILQLNDHRIGDAIG